MQIEGDEWGESSENNEVTNTPIITTEELDWFYGMDVNPAPKSLNQEVIDPVPYYLKDAPHITEDEARIKSTLKNRFEHSKARKALQTKVLEIDDVDENTFFFNS